MNARRCAPDPCPISASAESDPGTKSARLKYIRCGPAVEKGSGPGAVARVRGVRRPAAAGAAAGDDTRGSLLSPDAARTLRHGLLLPAADDAHKVLVVVQLNELAVREQLKERVVRVVIEAHLLADGDDGAAHRDRGREAENEG